MMAWLIENALVATVLAALALALAPLFRRRPAVVHLLWLVVILRLLLPTLPLPSSEWSEVDVLLATGYRSTPQDQDLGKWSKRPRESERERRMADPLVVSITVDDSQPRNPIAAAIDFLPRWLEGGLAALILGIGLFLAGRELRLGQQLRRGTRLAPREIRQRVHCLARSLKLRTPQVRTHRGLSSPLVLSGITPVLVLPEGAKLPDCVLVHELSHIARKDHWTALLEVATLILHWWNPIFRLAQKRLHAAAELSCDARAIGFQKDSPTEYARALVDAVERESALRLGTCALALGRHRGGFERRLRLILEDRLARGIPPLIGVVLVGLLALSLPAWGRSSRTEAIEVKRSAQVVPDGERKLLQLFKVANWSTLRQDAIANLRQNPGNGYAWHRLGFALLGLGQYDRAGRAFEAQLKSGWRKDLAAYNMACAACRGGHLEKALTILEELVKVAPKTRPNLARDEDLIPLRANPRFKALLSPSGKSAAPKEATRRRGWFW